MAKKSKGINLSQQEKAELKRLTQLVNRRIAQAQKVYEKAGRTIAPLEVTGGIQTKAQWASEKYAVSRSTTRFKTKKEFVDHMKWLRSFEGKAARPNMTEYTKIQQEKIIMAIETATSGELKDKLIKKIRKMTAPEMSDFWDEFSKVAARLGNEYSSDGAMIAALMEWFDEDIDQLLTFPEEEGESA